MADTIEAANAEITKLTTDLATAKSSNDSLNTLHTTVSEQFEQTKVSLTNSETQLRQLTDASKGSTKSLEDLQKQLTERDATITAHADSITAYTTLKTEHDTLKETILTDQKTRLTAAGIGDELLKDKDSNALTAMEVAIAVVTKVAANGTANPNGTGLTGGGNGQVPATTHSNTPGLGHLEHDLAEVKRAKQKAGVPVN